MTSLLSAIFFFSGASALVFESLWFHQAGLAFGNSIWASSLVLSGFMAGLALGNGVAARVGARLRRPVLAYVGAELAIAGSGPALVYVLPLLGPALAPWLGGLAHVPWLQSLARLTLAFALLALPSGAMGVTLPLLVQSLSRSAAGFGPLLGRLYGWNTLGAVAGVLAAELWLVEVFGVRGTSLLAGAVNAAAALCALGLARRLPAVPASAPGPAGCDAVARTARRGRVALLLAAAFACGAALLALEVVWFRLLSLFVLGLSSSFAWMLAVVLFGIAAGGLLAAWLLRAWEAAARHAGAAAFAAGVAALASHAAAPRFLPRAEAELLSEVGPILGVALPLMLPVSCLSGALFTLLGSWLRRELAGAARAAGALTLANTLGAALGSLAAGFLLLPVLGVERSLLALAALYAGVGALLGLQRGGSRRSAVAAGGLFAAAIAVFPYGATREHLLAPVRRFHQPGTPHVVALREGVSQTLVFVEREVLGHRLSHTLLTDGYSMSGNTDRARRYMKLYVYLPAALHARLERALLISYGVGSTAKALVDTRELEVIDVVDLSRDILDLSEVVFPDPAEHPLRDPRVRVHVEDGRYFLETTSERYDLITGEPPPPRVAGVVNLYTREYFALLRERLAEGGFVTYWLPLHAMSDRAADAILAAFCAVFDDCSLWHGSGLDLMLLGSRGATTRVDEARFRRQWEDPRLSGELSALGLERPEQLGALFIADAGHLRALVGSSPVLDDEHPKRVDLPPSDEAAQRERLRDWMRAAPPRERFANSDWVRRLWPEPLLARTLEHFEHQEILNAYFLGHWQGRDTSAPAVHRLLTGSTLRAPVAWLLGSSTDFWRALDEMTPAELEQPSIQYHVGVRLLSLRRFAEAAAAFERAESDAGTRRLGFRMRIYALCLAGDVEAARALARERFAELGGGPELPEFWQWMSAQFGVDPRGAAAGSRPLPHLANAR
jgi:predicted membrane-bound spermidine synthase